MNKCRLDQHIEHSVVYAIIVVNKSMLALHSITDKLLKHNVMQIKQYIQMIHPAESAQKWSCWDINVAVSYNGFKGRSCVVPVRSLLELIGTHL